MGSVFTTAESGEADPDEIANIRPRSATSAPLPIKVDTHPLEDPVDDEAVNALLEKIKPIKINTTPEMGIADVLDDVVSVTKPIMEGASAIGSLLDAPLVQEQPPPFFPRSQQYTIATDSITYKETLKAANHNGLSLSDKQAFQADGDESDLYNILNNTKQLTHRFTWKTSHESGKLLANFGVGPVPVNSHSTDGQVHDEIFHMFDFWAGGEVFLFDIACTTLHTGQLTIVYIPGGSASGLPDNLQEASQSYFATYDLSEGTGTISLTAPYLSNYQYAEVPNINGTRNNTYPGQIFVYVSNPLRATTVVAPEVEVLVYTAWAEDLRLGVYGNNSLIRRRL